MKRIFLLPAVLLLAVPAAAQTADYAPERVEQAISFAELKAVVAALGHVVEAEDLGNQSLRAATGDGTRYLLTGTACDIDGVPGCRGIVMQVLFEGAATVTLDKLAEANLKQVAVSTRFDPASGVLSVTRYVVLDGGATMANVAQNVEVLLALAPEVVAIVLAGEPGVARPD